MADDDDPDIAELVLAAERALAPVLEDLARTCEIPASIWVTWEDGYPRVWVSNGDSYGYSSAPIHQDHEMTKAEMADYVQEQLMDIGVERFWPTCHEHNRGLHAEVRDGTAVWFCRGGDHTIAALGLLGEG
ncbi:MAG: hypothetical protein ACT4OV_07045 [Microthrixaceae bacterium]